MQTTPDRAEQPEDAEAAERSDASTGSDKVAAPGTDSAGGDRERHLEESFDRIIDEGIPRMRRSWLDVLSTGAVGGVEVGFGILALLTVREATGSELLAGLAFSIGFIALLLGHSELFTEGFLVPVAVVAAGEARIRDLLRLWVGTMVGNLAGGLGMAAIVVEAFPSLHKTANEVAGTYVNSGINLRSFSLAVLAGGAITLLTRMHNGTDEIVAKLVASVAIAFLLVGAHLFHSVLNSLLAFVALLTGSAPFGYLDWLLWFAWVVAGNMVGGLGLTTMLRLVRSRRRLADYRVANRRPVSKRALGNRT